MFAYTGPWKKEMVEEKLVSAEEMIKEFNLPIDLKKPTTSFELNMDNQTVAAKDIDGNLKWAKGRNILPKVQGMLNGQSIVAVYYTSKTKRQGDTFFTYTPNRVEFKGKTITLDTQMDLELIVLHAISTMSSISPFRNKRMPAVFNLLDREARAVIGLKAEQEMLALKSKILNEFKDEQVVAIAKGYRRRDKSKLTVPSHVTAMECRVILNEELKRDFSWLKSNLESTSNMLSGIVRDGDDKGRLKYRDIGGGKRMWMYSNEIQIGVANSATGINGLIDFIIDKGIISDFKDKMDHFDKLDKVDANMSIQFKETKVTKDPLTFALDNELVWIDRSEWKLKQVGTTIEGKQITQENKVMLNIPEDRRLDWKEFINESKRTVNMIDDVNKKYTNAITS